MRTHLIAICMVLASLFCAPALSVEFDNGICRDTAVSGEVVEWGCGEVVVVLPEPEPDPEPNTGFELANLSPAELFSSDSDSSGVAIVDGNYVVTTQTQLQVYSPSGQLIESNSSGSNDVEGLDYSGDLIGVNEGPGRILEYSGIQAMTSTDLPFSNIECVARSGQTYYGIENSGDLLDGSGAVVMNVGRDFAGCTFHDGWFIALTSHPYRSSTVYRIDPQTWTVMETMSLPDGNWEGIDCNESLCVLVRESSARSGAGIQVYR